MLTAVIAGVALGLSVALPFGPVSLVCVQRSIAGGLKQGLVTGAGATSAHAVFAVAALVGQGYVASELIQWRQPIRWFSAGLLLWLGLRMLVRHGSARAVPAGVGIPIAYGSGLALALSNPMTILPYLGVASGAVVANGAVRLFSPWSVLGVVLGAAAWYTVLSSGASLFRAPGAGYLIRHLNLLAGTMLVVFSILIALK